MFHRLALGSLLLAGSLWSVEPAWGPVLSGLSMGIALEGSAPGRLLRVTFRNQGTAPQAFVVGGKTGIGSIHGFESVSLAPDGTECKLMDATVGVVAGYVEPIVVRLLPGQTQSVTIATQKMFCMLGRQTLPLDGRLAAGHKLRVQFTAKDDSNEWGRVNPGWTGTLVSGTIAGK